MIKAIRLRVPNSELLVPVHIDEAILCADVRARQPLPLLSVHASHFHEYASLPYGWMPKMDENEHASHDGNPIAFVRIEVCLCLCVCVHVVASGLVCLYSSSFNYCIGKNPINKGYNDNGFVETLSDIVNVLKSEQKQKKTFGMRPFMVVAIRSLLACARSAQPRSVNSAFALLNTHPDIKSFLPKIDIPMMCSTINQPTPNPKLKYPITSKMDPISYFG